MSEQPPHCEPPSEIEQMHNLMLALLELARRHQVLILIKPRYISVRGEFFPLSKCDFRYEPHADTLKQG